MKDGTKIQKSLILFFVIMLLLTPTIASAELAFPNDTNSFVIDEGNALNESEELEINQLSEGLNEYWGTEVVVVVINSTSYYDSDNNSSISLSNYGLELFKEWKIGDQEWKDGVLVILATNQSGAWEWRIENGEFWDLYLDFSSIGFDAGNELDEGNWFNGLKIITEEIIIDIEEFWEYNDGFVEPPSPNLEPLGLGESSGNVLTSILFLGFIGVVILVIIISVSKGRGISFLENGNPNNNFPFNRRNNVQHVYHHHDDNSHYKTNSNRNHPRKSSRRSGGSSRRSRRSSSGSSRRGGRSGGGRRG
ncbi:TPM domain-containing protein [Euryarchaeota archaeon]|nr:TPM domain-containing protein [Euryarchaeota archaeon]|tara:strand:+ start:3375 stop:4292 length:918 start_codon:yes stop_codon:yes gene_type:complete